MTRDDAETGGRWISKHAILAAGLKLLDYPVYLGLWKREKGYNFLYR